VHAGWVSNAPPPLQQATEASLILNLQVHSESVKFIASIIHFIELKNAAMELLSNLQLFIYYDAHALICCRKECQSALSIADSRVITHLRDKHHVQEDARKELAKALPY
jgi:hypothetical protein